MYSEAFHPDFVQQVEGGHGYSCFTDFLEDLSLRLPVYQKSLAEKRRTVIDRLNPDELRRLYYIIVLRLISMKRFKAHVSGLSSGALKKEDVNVKSWDDLHGLFSILRDITTHLSVTRKLNRRTFPVEDFVKQDPGALQHHCKVLIRLVLGRAENLSEVLQEDFIFSEAKILGDSYNFLSGTGLEDVLRELRDIRERIFAYVNLVAGYSSDPQNDLLACPPGAFIDESTKRVLDLGAGKYAWWSNAVARRYPGCDVFAYDKLYQHRSNGWGMELSDGRRLSNLNFVPVDFDDSRAISGIVDEHRGRIDFVLASNIFHKLRDPQASWKGILDLLSSSPNGRLYVYAPANPGRDGSDRDSTLAVSEQETTRYLSSLWTFDKTLEEIKNLVGVYGMKIRALSHIGPERGHNDAYHRIGLVLEKDSSK